MILLIDIGNSRSKYAFIDGDALGRIHNQANDDFNENFFNQHFNRVSEVIVASVAPESITDELASWCQQQNILYQRVVSVKQKAKLISAYQRAEQLGVDRWLTLVATSEHYPDKNVLIIDAGTATTVDLLSASGQHQGGWILAGINVLFHSVLQQTSKVDAEVSVKPSLAFGQNTSDNVNNASWAATVGTILLAVEQAKQILPSLDKIIITGGNAKRLQSLLNIEVQLIENLVFLGLQAYVEKD